MYKLKSLDVRGLEITDRYELLEPCHNSSWFRFRDSFTQKYAKLVFSNITSPFIDTITQSILDGNLEIISESLGGNSCIQ